MDTGKCIYSSCSFFLFQGWLLSAGELWPTQAITSNPGDTNRRFGFDVTHVTTRNVSTTTRIHLYQCVSMIVLHTRTLILLYYAARVMSTWASFARVFLTWHRQWRSFKSSSAFAPRASWEKTTNSRFVSFHSIPLFQCCSRFVHDLFELTHRK